MSGHYPDGAEPDDRSFRCALEDLAAALDDEPFRVLVMGGVGSASHARPRPTDDIDLFVHPEDADALLGHLAGQGFEVARSDPTWLFKAFRHGVLIDVIFRSTGDIYVDDEMLRRAQYREFKGVRLPLVSPEDLILIKAVAAAEHAPHHWYDALGIIARCDLDWDYLVNRSRRLAPRRVLSLLLYAESNDLAVPATAIEALFSVLHPAVTVTALPVGHAR
jgi:predicted nucleotidyltransferase